MDFKDCIRMQYNFVAEYSHGSLETALKGLTREELVWQPAPNGMSIGLIFFHQARWMDSYLHSRLQNIPDIWETQGWYKKFNIPVAGVTLRTVKEIAAFVIPPIEDLRAYESAARAKILEYIESKTTEDFNEKVDYPFGVYPNLGNLLATMVCRLGFYVGQIIYLSRLQRGEIRIG